MIQVHWTQPGQPPLKLLTNIYNRKYLNEVVLHIPIAKILHIPIAKILQIVKKI